MLLKKTLMLASICTLPVLSYAQEWNIGIHVNPVLTTPMQKEKTAMPYLKLSPARLNIGGGINLNFKKGQFCIETGANGIIKTLALKYRQRELDNQAGYTESSYTYTSESSSLEIPLQLGYIIHHHQQKMIYDVYAILGAGYEMNTSQGYASRSTSFSSAATAAANGAIIFDGGYPQSGVQKQWINIIGGFKINAILRKVGLIDYGITFHYATGDAGPHQVTAYIADGGTRKEVTTAFTPSLSHIDIKLCYYFLNLDKSLHRIGYRYQ